MGIKSVFKGTYFAISDGFILGLNLTFDFLETLCKKDFWAILVPEKPNMTPNINRSITSTGGLRDVRSQNNKKQCNLLIYNRLKLWILCVRSFIPFFGFYVFRNVSWSCRYTDVVV